MNVENGTIYQEVAAAFDIASASEAFNLVVVLQRAVGFISISYYVVPGVVVVVFSVPGKAVYNLTNNLEIKGATVIGSPREVLAWLKADDSTGDTASETLHPTPVQNIPVTPQVGVPAPPQVATDAPMAFAFPHEAYSPQARQRIVRQLSDADLTKARDDTAAARETMVPKTPEHFEATMALRDLRAEISWRRVKDRASS